MRRNSLFFSLGVALLALWLGQYDAQDLVGISNADQPVATDNNRVVVDLIDGIDIEAIEALEAKYKIDLHYVSELTVDEALLHVDTTSPAALIAALQKESIVEAVESEIAFTAYGYPNDPDFDKQWNMQLIGVDMPWRASQGQNIRVAVLDTGVSQVEDLKNTEFGPGASFVPGVATPEDDHGHGTHVAGTIAQSTHNGKGVVGVAPEAIIMPYKVLGRTGGGQSSWIAGAIDQAVDDGADIINMSLGSPIYSRVIHLAIQKAVAEGVVVVAAAGNTGRQGVGYPGRLKEVIGVSAVGPSAKLAPYSSWGKGVEIAAPGGNLRVPNGGILQDTVDGRGGHAYRAFQGTSMASPHVAGSVAVLMGMGLDGRQAVDTLLRTAKGPALEDGPDKKYGYGVLDLKAAVSDVIWRQWGMRFAMAGFLAAAFVFFAGLPAAGALSAGAISALTAGGLFFLPYLGMAPNGLQSLLSRGLLEWPTLLGGASLSHFPLWVSAAFPLLICVIFGLSRRGGMLAAGIATGFGISLINQAMGMPSDVLWLSSSMDSIWLWGNGLVALVAALAVIGVQRNRGVNP